MTAAATAAAYIANAHGDWDDPTPYVDPRPQITCGHCGQTHHAVAIVAACHRGADVATCEDVVSVWSEDGPVGVACGEDAAFTADGWFCSGGHSYVAMTAREAQGWDYAGDEYDAAVIMRGGREARPMGPHTHIDPALTARIFAEI